MQYSLPAQYHSFLWNYPLLIFIINYLILNNFWNRLFLLEHHIIKRRSQLKHCDIRRPSKHQHPRWNYSANSKRQKIEFTIQILPIFLPSVFRFNWALSLALSGSGYVYFKRNLLLAYDDSTVFLENEICKQVDSWWASVKRKISGLSHAFARDDAANHPEKAKDVNQNLILSNASSSSSEREVFHAFHIASKSIETLNCCISLSVIVGTLRFVDFSKVLKRLIWTYMIFFLMLNLSSDVISINSCKFRFWVQW